ncbi:ComEC/Rec2 family competence protein [Vaginisenegalia massiliensis]|uniref:ComEC/Rec2 family competence protein n=1 Tax=Vaginisenegalia massiliensis TaxID=2058294 RepID=UPI000F5325B5|nr:ComEC/Rec2 family competence protein [Vaginisenegalia massiliensis]
MSTLKNHGLFAWLVVLSFLWWCYYPQLSLCLVLLVTFGRMILLKQPKLLGLTLLCCFLVWGHMQWQNNHEPVLPLNQPISLTLQCLSVDLQPTQSGNFQGASRVITPQGFVPVIVTLPKDVLTNQELMANQALLMKVQGHFEAFEKARNFYTFDYQAYYQQEGYQARLIVESIDSVTYESGNWLSQGRLFCLNYFKRYQEIEWVGLHNKLLLNLNSPSFKFFRQDLISLGIIHFFAISGFHMDYLRRKFSLLCWRIGISRETTWYLVSLISLIYGSLIAWPVGVIRSLGASLLKGPRHEMAKYLSDLDCMCLIGIGLLIVKPSYCVNLAYLLSFSLSALLHLYQPSVWAKQGRFRQTCEQTIMCLLFSWPLIMQQSFEWNWQQILTIIICSFFFERFFMPAMIITTGLLLCPYEGSLSLVVWVNQVFCSIWQLGQRLAGFLPSALVIGYLNQVLFGGLVLVAILWNLWLPTKPQRAWMLVVIAYTLVWLSPYLNPYDRMTVLDVGQGDALLFQEAFNQSTWLIDTGGKQDFQRSSNEILAWDTKLAQRQLIPALKALGVRRLNVIISHPDLDHVGNLPTLSANLPIDRVMIHPYCLKQANWLAIQETLKGRVSIQPLDLKALPYSINSKLCLLADKQATFADDTNDWSLVCLLRIGQYLLINMGDLSQKGEEHLIRQYSGLKADILKVGHHGSRHSTSETWLKTLGARMALISSGQNNRYGHPHEETLLRLNQAHLAILRTDVVGAIQFSASIWGDYQIRTALKPMNSQQTEVKKSDSSKD